MQVQPRSNDLQAEPAYANKIAALQEEVATLKAAIESLRLEASTRPVAEVRQPKLPLADSSETDHLTSSTLAWM